MTNIEGALGGRERPCCGIPLQIASKLLLVYGHLDLVAKIASRFHAKLGLVGRHVAKYI